MTYMDQLLSTDKESAEFLAIGYCDVAIQNLSFGTVKLQYKLPATQALPSPEWKDFPDGSFTADTFQTIFVSQHGVMVRFVGLANNAGVYVKAARHNNK